MVKILFGLNVMTHESEVDGFMIIVVLNNPESLPSKVVILFVFLNMHSILMGCLWDSLRIY